MLAMSSGVSKYSIELPEQGSGAAKKL